MAKNIKIRVLDADEDLDGGKTVRVPASFMEEFKDALLEHEVRVKGSALCYYREGPEGSDVPSFLVTALTHRQKKILNGLK